MNKKLLYKKAIKKWGQYAQMDIMAEECAELIKAVMKLRGYPNRQIVVDDLLEEMADVEIMLEQLKIIFNYKYSNDAVDMFKDTKRRKLERLEKQLNGL